MLAIVEKILSMEVEAVISSPASLDLLKCYSKLYLGGASPRTCAVSQRNYYDELKKTGINRAKRYDMAQIRTCEPKHKGTFQVRNYGFVISSQMTDEQAIYMLNNKLLTESDFIKLPNGYSQKQAKVAEVVDEVIAETTETTQEQPAKKERKPRTKKN